MPESDSTLESHARQPPGFAVDSENAYLFNLSQDRRQESPGAVHCIHLLEWMMDQERAAETFARTLRFGRGENDGDSDIIF